MKITKTQLMVLECMKFNKKPMKQILKQYNKYILANQKTGL